MAVRAGTQVIHNEASFTSPEELVEKNEIDMFGTLLDRQQPTLDIFFVGSLHKFNLPLIQIEWQHNESNLLDLPCE